MTDLEALDLKAMLAASLDARLRCNFLVGFSLPADMQALVLDPCEAALYRFVMERVDGNQVQASRILGVNRNTLRKRLVKHGLAAAASATEGGPGAS